MNPVSRKTPTEKLFSLFRFQLTLYENPILGRKLAVIVSNDAEKSAPNIIDQTM